MSTKPSRYAAALWLSLALAACGGSGGGGSGGSGVDEGAETQEQAEPIVGTDGTLLVDAIRTTSVVEPAGDAWEISETGEEILRTVLMIVMRPDATAGQVRAMLALSDGRITQAISGLRSFTIRIPDPGSLDALDERIQMIEAAEGVSLALRSPRVVGDALEPATKNAIGDPSLDGFLSSVVDHHLAVRGHLATNARAAATAVPNVLIVDRFGDGRPRRNFGIELIDDDFAKGIPSDHGYGVLGVLAAAWDDGDTDRGHVTSIQSTDIKLAVDDITFTDNLMEQLNSTVISLQKARRETDSPTPFVVNYSQGAECQPNADTGLTCREPELVERWEERAKVYGALWANAVRAAGLEGQVLFVCSAGNVEPTSVGRDARIASACNAATRDDLYEPGDDEGFEEEAWPAPVPPLEGVLVVEGADHFPGPPATYEPLCLSGRSFINGDIAGIYSNVYTMAGPENGAMSVSGTSFAAPQVASLAALLWSLDPNLSVAEVRDRILHNAQPPLVRCSPADPTRVVDPDPPLVGVIDAYATALSVDRGFVSTWDVRRAILDVTGPGGGPDGRFDEDDLVAFVDYFDQHSGSYALAHARYDLNGDGFINAGASPFDLSASVPVVLHNAVEATIDGEVRSFDETAVTDADILCYYAWSDLWADDALDGARFFALEDLCELEPKRVRLGCDDSDYPLFGSSGYGECQLAATSRLFWQEYTDHGELIVPETEFEDVQSTVIAASSPSEAPVEISSEVPRHSITFFDPDVEETLTQAGAASSSARVEIREASGFGVTEIALEASLRTVKEDSVYAFQGSNTETEPDPEARYHFRLSFEIQGEPVTFSPVHQPEYGHGDEMLGSFTLWRDAEQRETMCFFYTNQATDGNTQCTGGTTFAGQSGAFQLEPGRYRIQMTTGDIRVRDSPGEQGSTFRWSLYFEDAPPPTS